MPHLIIVEGSVDKAIVQKIARKLGVKVKTLLMRGNDPDKAIRLINAKLSTEDYSKVIVLKDQHQDPEDKVRECLNNIVSSVQYPRTYPIIVKKAIEAWILASMGITNSENIDDPATYLDQIMKRKGKRYIKSPENVGELVENMNLQQAMKYSHTLRQFIEVLKDP